MACLIRIKEVMIALLCWIFLSSCNCEDCDQAIFSAQELFFLYEGLDQLEYSNDNGEVFSVDVKSSITQSDEEQCATFPQKPICSSLSTVNITAEKLGLVFLLKIIASKNNNGLTINKLEVGNKFFLHINGLQTIDPQPVNSFSDLEIVDLGTITINGKNYTEVYQITDNNTQINNSNELVSFLYASSGRILELNFINPKKTFQLLPN